MMPVHVLTLDQWYCVPWDRNKHMEVLRISVNSDAEQLSCLDSFVSAFGVSIEPHRVSCPVGCLRTFERADIVGCGIYAVDSPICIAAIHAGVLTDEGGEATIFGRVGVPLFRRCSQNLIVSTERYVTQVNAAVSVSKPAGSGHRLVTAPLVQGSDAVMIPQAF